MNSTIDTIVIFVFSAFVLAIGMLFARTGRNLKSFFAGGEAVPWFIGGLSLFLSFFSAGTFVAFGFVAAFVIYHICYIGGNWTFVQRYTSVDSPKSAKKVAFLFAGLYLISPI